MTGWVGISAGRSNAVNAMHSRRCDARPLAPPANSTTQDEQAR